MASLVLTNCTSRKSAGSQVKPLSAEAWTSVAGAATRWRAQVEEVSNRSSAASVYQGRSVQEALGNARKLEAELWFVSAGLGLVRGDVQIPRYDLTLSSGRASITPHLLTLAATPADWWAAVTSGSGLTLAELLARQPDRTVYLTLPAPYLALLGRELEVIGNSEHAQRLWIFTGAPGRRALPAAVRARALPYDQRLELIGPAGTQADFPQRCLTHFISLGLTGNVSAQEAAAAVDQALAARAMPARPNRRVVTDREAMELIRAHWHGQAGQSGRLLRHLRSGLGVACEQGRFRLLYHRVREALALEQGPMQ
jgi:hypothetical protein